MWDSLKEEDVVPVQVVGGEIEMVDHFPYLGSIISKGWRCHGGCEMQDCKSF